jgi:hypothetical protein
MNAKRTPKKGIIGEGKIGIRPSKNTNRLRVTFTVSREEEQRLLKMLQKRYPKAS